MDILYLSHCVPNPPDKGEKIRAHREVLHLAARHRVHLVCFARNESETRAAHELDGRCASVYAERLSFPLALGRGFVEFAFGRCLTTSFYGSGAMRRRVAELAAAGNLSATVAFSSAMAPYAPPAIPLILDMADVDSEKWFQYAAQRHPAFVYRMEGRRLREVEVAGTARARRTILVTEAEERLLREFTPGQATMFLENGVDLADFDPVVAPDSASLAGRRSLVFVGAMDYYPNAEGAVWFADRVLPLLRDADPALEFWVVGRNPGRPVRRLASRPGVTVTGSVPDVRPYLKAAVAAVAPLQIARGIQNKVLEALAMGKTVLSSTAVCDTFGPELPFGVIRCVTERDYVTAAAERRSSAFQPDIRSAAEARFSWERNLRALDRELEAAVASRRAGVDR
jgi:sugar transferase (PEP-CTERM/EpsH1 system associated)